MCVVMGHVMMLESSRLQVLEMLTVDWIVRFMYSSIVPGTHTSGDEYCKVLHRDANSSLRKVRDLAQLRDGQRLLVGLTYWEEMKR